MTTSRVTTGRDAREQSVLDRIERSRRRAPRVTDPRITMAHGGGGKAMRTLVEAVFLEEFRNPLLEPLEDHAALAVGDTRVAFTTDGFVVSPLFFPGGCIGDLAVNGTVNDLAVSGARPLALSAAFILEEGFDLDRLRDIVAAMRAAADAAGVAIATGDTKVVERGKGDGCFITTSGIGVFDRPETPRVEQVQPGDALVVSGPIGDHGVTILLARGELELESAIVSDTAPLHETVRGLLDACPSVRWMRDATRGGVAAIANELADATDFAVTLDETSIPLRPEVRGACELLGIDPLHVACEGRFVAVVAAHDADAAVAALRTLPHGEGAARIGTVEPGPAGLVLLRTTFGGTRIVDLPVGEPLPRIC